MLSFKFNQAGDTIIEVLIALAILGSALSIGFATASQSLTKANISREHNQAQQILDKQVELLRRAAPSFATPANNVYLTSNVFCMDTNGSDTPITRLFANGYVRPADSPSDILKAAATPTLSDPYNAACQVDNGRYFTSIVYTPSVNGVDPDDLFTIKVRWDGLSSLGRQEAVLSYKIHQPTAGGGAVGGAGAPIPPPPVVPTLQTLEGETFSSSSPACNFPINDNYASAGRTMRMWCNGATSQTIAVAAFTSVHLRMRENSYSGDAIARFSLDGVVISDIPLTTEYYKDYSLNVAGAAGIHTFRVDFINDACGGNGDPCDNPHDRNLYFDVLTLNGAATGGSLEPACPYSAPSTPADSYHCIAPPPPPPPPVVNTLPIYRTNGNPYYPYYNPYHSFTPSVAERNNDIANGNSYEGIGFYGVDAVSGPGAVPIYRLNFAYDNRLHYFTRDQSEVNAAVSSGSWQNAGISFYDYPSNVNGNLVPVHRLYKTYNFEHFYTTSDAEYQSAMVNYGYVDEGIAFWAPPGSTSPIPPPQPTNVALSKPVTNGYCPSYNYYYFYPDSNLTDGNKSTQTSQCNYNFQYVTDLGNLFNLSSVTATWGVFGCLPWQICGNGNWYIRYDNIEVSTNGSNWTSIHSDNSGYGPQAAETVIPGSFIAVRYIRVTGQSYNNWIAMKELTAIGTPL